MNREELLKKIARAARRDRKRREDPRYLEIMGFLVAKGFLHSNRKIGLRPNGRIAIADAVWAGTIVEPRILEVLPAAILRLPRHFDLDPVRHPDLFAVIKSLERDEEKGLALWGIPYPKFRSWVHLPLRDGRVKSIAEKRVTKTFRLKPSVIDKLKQLVTKLECTETEALERAITNF